MGRHSTIEATVLKTYDVGEADRFCILLSRERGRIAVRAKAVRKLTSKMGGILLPLQHISAEIHDGKNGILITSAQAITTFDASNVESFMRAQQGTELLMMLIHDEDPVPEIFEAYTVFLCTTQTNHQCVLSFTLHVLNLLGILPALEHEGLSKALTAEEKQFLITSTSMKWWSATAITGAHFNRLKKWTEKIVEHQGASQSKSDKIAAML